MNPRAALATAAAAFVLTGCATEPPNGCMLAAMNQRAVLRAKNYLNPNVESHLLAIWFHSARHVALVIKGDHRWFAWDDAYGGRPLFLDGPAQLPDALDAARAAFPRMNVEMAWWVDEPQPPPRASQESSSIASTEDGPAAATKSSTRRSHRRMVATRRSTTQHRGTAEHSSRKYVQKRVRAHRANRA